MLYDAVFQFSTIKLVKYGISCSISDTSDILDKIDALDSAVKQNLSNCLHQKQADFDKDYTEFKQHIAEILVS